MNLFMAACGLIDSKNDKQDVYINVDIPLEPFKTCDTAYMAQQLVEIVRLSSTNGRPVINFDLAMNFVNCLKIFVEKYGLKGADMETGYHWTKKQNLDKIADTNFWFQERVMREGKIKSGKWECIWGRDYR
eukprot:UN04924